MILEFYCIYHAPLLNKVGCTKRLEKRLYEQGLILGIEGTEIIDMVSSDCGAAFAGDVERAWARWFGYPTGAHYLSRVYAVSNRGLLQLHLWLSGGDYTRKLTHI